MTKAEEQALKVYPRRDKEYYEVSIARGFFRKGYEQAEKDLAPLIEAAMIVYEAWNGGTMDDVRRGMDELEKRFKEIKK